MSLSNNSWGSDYNRDLATTNEEFEFNQSGKPTKAVIGIGLLVAFGIALAFFQPSNRDTASTPASQITADTARSNSLNAAPGQTTGSAGSSPSARSSN